MLTALLPWAMLLFMVWVPQAVRADVLTGRVVAVADGDTVTVLDADQNKHKIRLAGIDAPESRQPYGQRSRQSLSDLVSGQWVQVVYDKADRYGRLVGKVQVAGRDANLEQLRRGLAWHYKKYEGEQGEPDRQAYAAAEQQAQSARLGLWRDTGPQAPWDYRQLQRRPDGP
jgi:endonuclease YncB( thermonuclease family)